MQVRQHHSDIARALCAGLFVAALVLPVPALAQLLGTASNFASLGRTPNVTNSGPTRVSWSGGASAGDLWWQIGSSASIGTFSAMQGNILALTSITLGTSATLQGRALARNGTVTLASNTVNACAGGSSPGFIVGAPGVASTPV